MKTIEEKAKAYDEALERAKAYHRNELAGSRKEMTEYIFPELKESEDERMMREFNDWLCEEIECRTNDLRDEKDRRTLNMLCYILTKVKDWLEKQKEPFESGRGLYYYDGEKTTYCGYPATEDNPYDFAMSQQKEQKPVDTSDDELQRHQDELYDFKVFAAKQAREHYISFVHDFEWNNFCAELLSYFNEKQKPAEKQDYSGLNDLERAIHRGFLCAGVENVPVTIIKETAQECLAHIKPVELKYWDKEMIQSIISILERDNCFKVVDEKPMRIFAHEQEINYLRNLQESLS